MGKCIARDSKGRFFTPICPLCHEPMVFDGVDHGRNVFKCFELRDPKDDSKPLIACLEYFMDYDERPTKAGEQP